MSNSFVSHVKKISLALALVLGSGQVALSGDTPSMKVKSGTMETPATAWSYYQGQGVVSPPINTDRDELVKELGRSFKGDPDEIYTYIRNNIEIEPMFGLMKGARGAIRDGYGTAFDQAQLMVDLVREGGGTAQYVYSDVTLNGTSFDDLFGITNAKAACQFLADGGFPATVNGSADCSTLTGNVTSVNMAHIWVQAQINSTWYTFDPAYKTHTKITGMSNLDTSMGFSSASTLNALKSGYSRTGNRVTGLNGSSARTVLETNADALLAVLKNDANIDTVEEIVGGQEIDAYEGADLRQATPGSQYAGYTSTATWAGEIPNSFRTTMQYQTQGINLTYFVDEIYGKRMTLRPMIAGFGNECNPTNRTSKYAVLYMGHNSVSQFDDKRGTMCPYEVARASIGGDAYWMTDQYQTIKMEITINHPYAASSGTYMDETIEKIAGLGYYTEISLGFGTYSRRHRHWQEKTARQYKYRYSSTFDDSGSHIPGGCMYYGWNKEDFRQYYCGEIDDFNHNYDGNKANHIWELHQDKDILWGQFASLQSKMANVLASLGNGKIQHHHSVGLVLAGDRSETQNISTYLNTIVGYRWVDVESAFSINSNTANTTDRDAMTRVLAAEQAGLEQQVMDQQYSYYSSNRGSSAVSMMTIAADKANDAFVEIDSITDVTNFSGAGWTIQGKAILTDYVNAGFDLVVPEDVSGSTDFAAFWAIDALNDRTSYIVIDPDVDSLGMPYVPRKGGVQQASMDFSEYRPSGSPDYFAVEQAGFNYDVDLRTGNLSFSPRADLKAGNGDFPYSLAFQRSYSSANVGRGSLERGWSHNYDGNVASGSSAWEAMGASNVRAAVPFIVALRHGLDTAKLGSSAEHAVAESVIANWWRKYALQNTVSVSVGAGGEQFVRLADDSYASPMSSNATITITNPSLMWTEGELSTTYYYPDNGEKLTFGVILASGMQQCGFNGSVNRIEKRKARLTTWQFPNGAPTVSFAYYTTNFVALSQVSNTLGFKINYNSINTDTGNFSCNPAYDEGHITWATSQYSSTAATVKVAFEYKYISGSQFAFKSALDTVNHTEFGMYTTSPKWKYTYGNDNCPPDTTILCSLSSGAITEIYTPDDDTIPALTVEYVEAAGEMLSARISKVTDKDGIATNYFIGGNRSHTEDAYGNGPTSYYNVKGQRYKSKDALGNISTALYDDRGRTIEETMPELNKKLTEYDSYGNVIKTTLIAKPGCTGDCADIISTASFSNKAVTTGTIYGLKDWEKSAQNYADNPTSTTNRTDYAYDTSGRLSTTTTPLVYDFDTVSNVRAVTTNTYNGYGQLLTITDAKGVVTANTYATDGTSNLTNVVVDNGGLNITTSFAYDATNKYPLVGVATPTGYYGASYDALRRLTEVTGPETSGSKFFYDDASRITSVQQKIFGIYTTVQTVGYTTGGRVLTETDAESHVTATYDYDDAGRKLSVTDGKGNVTRTVYDEMSRASKVIRAWQSGIAIPDLANEDCVVSGSDQQCYQTYAYSANGQKIWVENAKNYRTSYVFDGFDRLLRVQFPDADAINTSNTDDYEEFAYDTDGNVLSMRTRNGDWILAAFDDAGRMETETTQVGDIPTNIENIVSFFYDKLGQQREVSQNIDGHAITYSYDNAGRITTTIDGGKTLSNLYNPGGNRERLTYADGFYVTYAYDGLGRVTSIKENGVNNLATYSYNGHPSRQGTTLGNGKTVAYDYFADGALKQFTQSGIAVGSANLSYDFTYFANHQMASRAVSDSSFVWLPNADSTEDYNDANGLDQYECIDGDPLNSCLGGKSLTYEGNGNLLTYEGWTYTYSVKNQLLSAAKSGQETVTFTYDSLGRRSSKTVGTSTITFLSDGVEEIADYDGANLKYRYVNGSGVDERLAYYEYNTGGTQINKEYYHVDWQGSVIATSDTTGNRVELHSYDAFGNPTDGTGQPFKYTGRRWDNEVGLYYYRARYYHPTLGRFLQTDPVGYADNMNMYAYVGNDPMNNTDPSGMMDRSDPNSYFIKGGHNNATAQDPAVKPNPTPNPTQPDTKPPSQTPNAANDNNKPRPNFFVRALTRIGILGAVSKKLNDLNDEGNKLYRGLSPRDEKNMVNIGGVLAKDPKGNKTMEEHANDSDGSQYISLTRDKKVAEEFAGSGGWVAIYDGQKLLFIGGLREHDTTNYGQQAKENVEAESEVLFLIFIPNGALQGGYKVP